jgi:SAM-dependent methyltransferase
MLGQVLRDLLHYQKAKRAPIAPLRVLNVGGQDKAIPIPSHYDGWEHLLLDIDPRGRPDIVCDARNMTSLKPAQFDAVYCSHNLEHYYRHDAMKVLNGFRHVLKGDGFVEIRVPDLQSVIQRVSTSGMDLGDILYQSAAGPIAVLDVIYGLSSEIERSGQDFFAHKSGFTPKLLKQMLQRAGFVFIQIFVTPDIFETRAIAFKSEPSSSQTRLLGLRDIQR